MALGSSLPLSIILGRMGPIVSGFAPVELELREGRVSSARASFFTGLGVAVILGVSATERCSSEAAGGGLGLSSRSAASAPAFRICSSVGVVELDLFSRDFRFVGSGGGGVGDSDWICSGGWLAWRTATPSRSTTGLRPGSWRTSWAPYATWRTR